MGGNRSGAAAEKYAAVPNGDGGLYSRRTAQKPDYIGCGKREFRILKLTDIHIGGSATTPRKDEKALRACQTII